MSTFVLDALGDRDCAARVPMTWALEISNVLARAERGFPRDARQYRSASGRGDFARALTDTLPLATLDAGLSKAARRAGVKRFSPH